RPRRRDTACRTRSRAHPFAGQVRVAAEYTRGYFWRDEPCKAWIPHLRSSGTVVGNEMMPSADAKAESTDRMEPNPQRGRRQRADDPRTRTGTRLPFPTGTRARGATGAPRPRTAFVLSGGGNQGVSQVGMLRALIERGLVHDVV